MATAEQQIMLTDIARHIAVRYLYIRELVGYGAVTIIWVSSSRNLADIFTKALAFPALKALSNVLRGMDRLWKFY